MPKSMAYTPLCMRRMALLQSLSIHLLLLASMLVPRPGSAEETPSGYRVELIHVIDDAAAANGSFTREALISRAMERVDLREATPSGSDGKKTVAHYREPYYLIEAKIGIAPEPFLAVFDTGSDLVWTRQMDHCNRDGSSSSSSNFNLVSCPDAMCDGCYDGMCMFDKKYGTEGKAAKGYLGSATLALSGVTTDKDITLGCAIDHDAQLIPKPADGIVGLSRGPRSLWRQMKVTSFSYCLSNQFTDKLSSPLWMGLPVVADSEMKSTPLVQLSADGYKYKDKYHVELSAISIGEKKTELLGKKFRFRREHGEVPAMMVDSGVWRTFLEDDIFVELNNLLAKNEKLKGPNPRTIEGMLYTCFNPEANNKPPLKLHFKPDAEMLIPWDYYMYPVDSEFCLAINKSIAGGISILGNFLQQNIHMHYDLTQGEEKLSFKRVDDCSKLV